VEKLQAYQFRLEPNGKQRKQLERYAGCCRFVYNRALAKNIEAYKLGEKYPGKYRMTGCLPSWKVQFPWLKDAPSQALMCSLLNLDKAYKAFWKGGGFPKFKKKSGKASVHFPQGFKISDSRICLPKLGTIKYRKSKNITGEIRSITVSKQADHWFVSMLTKQEVSAQQHNSSSIIGIDVGVINFVTMSDGTFIKPISAFKKHAKRLALLQRRAAKKKKWSANRKKANAKVTRCFARISNTRKDFLHKISTTICKNHAIVCIEDLQVANMSRSAAGSIETPGKNVSQKSGLNRSILDQGWSEFRRQLEYKMAWSGGKVIAVPAQYTSQTCPNCQHCSKSNRQTQAKFECVNCSYKNNADIVGALNILERGHRLLVCGDRTIRLTKQKPTEETYAKVA
jgi:putative transposase